MERSYAELARTPAKWSERIDPKVALEEPFESGLPACRARRVRRIDRAIPPAAVGQRLTFAPSGEGIVFVTRARRRKDLWGKLVATPQAIAAFEVRCVPTTVVLEKGGVTLQEGTHR